MGFSRLKKNREVPSKPAVELALITVSPPSVEQLQVLTSRMLSNYHVQEWSHGGGATITDPDGNPSILISTTRYCEESVDLYRALEINRDVSNEGLQYWTEVIVTDYQNTKLFELLVRLGEACGGDLYSRA